MARVPDNPDNPQEFARYTFDEWKNKDTYYNFWTDRWRRTLNFLRSQHWRALRKYGMEELPAWREYPVINYTLAFYNDFLTSFLKSEVRFSALPASPDPQDVSSAELSEQLLKYLWDKLDFDQLRVDLAAWIIATGTGVLRIYWDTNTGDMVPLGIPTPDGGFMPVDPDSLQPMPGADPEMVDAGDVGAEVISPQFVRWGQSESDGVMLGLLLSYEEASALYGEKKADKLSYSDSHAGISADLNFIQQPGHRPTDEDRALVIEHYLPKSARYPNGVWWTAGSGGRDILTGPWPLPAGIVPVVGFRWLPVPGERNLGISPLHDMTFSNKIYERMLGRVLEWHKEIVPKTLLKSGGGLSYGDIDDKPGQELVVNQGAEPEVFEFGAPPGSFQNLMRTAQNDLMMVSGKQFAQEDTLPEGAATTRFRKPNELQPGHETAVAQINSKTAWKNVGEVLLSYVATFYTEPRVVAVQGPDRTYQWKEFKGADLGDLSATIKVDELPLYPWNRQAQKDLLVALMNTEMGQALFMDESGQMDMDRVQAALSGAGLDVGTETMDPDIIEARNEHTTFQNLQQGEQPPQVEAWQSHEVHYDEHTSVLKSLRFKSWPQHAQQAFMQHVQETSDQLNQAAEEEAKAMIEQERQLREVREQAELKSAVQLEWARELIGMLSSVTDKSMDELVQMTGGGESGGEAQTQETTTEE